MGITGRLAAVERPVSDKYQVPKLFRVLPELFAPLKMVASPVDIPFNRLSSAVQAEIARRASPSNAGRGSSAPPTAKLA